MSDDPLELLLGPRPITSQSARPCGRLVYWWDGEYEGNCELPEGHEGPHFDGMSWFNDDNEEVDDPNGD